MPTQAGRVATARRVTPAAAASAFPKIDDDREADPVDALGDDVLAPGAQIGEYELTEKIGEGGMGVVWGGVHPVIGKRVAIKLLNPGLSQDATIVQRFLQEARAVNQIGHRNIVDIFAFGQLPSGRHYFVMEFLKGHSLKGRLGQEPPLSQSNACTILAEVADALAAAHGQEIVHRDLKPDNIFLCESDGPPQVKLLDFGIAKLLRRADDGLGQTRTGSPIGTPYYMSPEQCRSKGVDGRTDLYAMGVIMFEIFTGRLPFAGASYIDTVNAHISSTSPLPSDFAPLPAALENMILRCLEKDPDHRPQHADELRTFLRGLASTIGDAPLPAPVRSTALSVTSPAHGSGSQPRSTVASSPRGMTPRPGVAAPSRTGRVFGVAVAVTLALALALALGLGIARSMRERAQAPVAAPTVALDVTSDPPGAALFVDGRAQSTATPAVVHVARAADVAVRLEKAGYRPHDEIIHLDGVAARRALAIRLVPLPATLRATATAAGVSWNLDDAPVGRGALLLDSVPAGAHRLRAEARGFDAREETIALTGGATTVVEWQLQPARRRRAGAPPHRASVPDAPNLEFKAPQ
jgi:serine/threonine-protein kinase